MAASTGLIAAATIGALTGGLAAKNQVDNSIERKENKLRDSLIKPQQKVPDMPGLKDENIKKARNMRLQQLMQRSGRESTMLSQQQSGNKLGG